MEKEGSKDVLSDSFGRGPYALRALLRSLVGKTLSVDDAASVIICAFAAQTKVEPASLPSCDYKSWRFERASVESAWPEVSQLHREFWLETSDRGRGIEPNPDPIRFSSAELSGRYVLFVVRDIQSGEIVGCCGMHFSFALRAPVIVAHEDGVYIRPDHRKGWMFARFMKYIEQCCKTLGADEIRVDANIGLPTNRALLGMGFSHVANHYIKIIGEHHHVV